MHLNPDMDTNDTTKAFTFVILSSSIALILNLSDDLYRVFNVLQQGIVQNSFLDMLLSAYSSQYSLKYSNGEDI